MFDHLGLFRPIWTLLDHFRQKLIFLLQSTLTKRQFVFLRKTIDFGRNRSKNVQKGQKWSQITRDKLDWPFVINLDHLRPLWDIGKLAMIGHFCSKRVFFWIMHVHASRSQRVASRSDRGLPRRPWRLPRALIAGCLEVSCAGRLEVRGNKLWDQNFQFYVVFWPFWPKRALPHPITNQNMMFGW